MRETKSSSICHVLIISLLFVLMQEPTLAIKQSYIVYLGSHSFGPNPSSFDIESATNSHYDLLGSYLGSTEKAKEAIFYSYNKYINGFAAILDEDEATKIAKNPNVVSIFLNKKLNLHTTRTGEFFGLERVGEIPKDSLWKKSLGEDVIIANLDTGVWPESKSFSDEGIGPIPKKWRGICQVGNGNPDKFHCNRKLIGARYFHGGYKAHFGLNKDQNVSYNSARDFDGHGTHTLSTAGGNFVANVSVFGHGNGTASGGSPKARLVAYKICYDDGCDEADVLAAFEHAISDGVDVISLSLGPLLTPEYFKGSFSIGSFHAVANNIIVVASAGNSDAGPSPYSVTNVEPWILTVAASTIDRYFTSYVILGNKKKFKGTSLSVHELPPNKLYPLIMADDAMVSNVSADDAMLCKEGTIDPHKANGKILVCVSDDDEESGVYKGVEASRVGAIGMILAKSQSLTSSLVEINLDAHVLPASNVNYSDGNDIIGYVRSTKFPVGYITRVKTELGIKHSPSMASFSSTGPNDLDPSILKPDITAPGVNIIAAYSEAISPSRSGNDKRRTPFITMSGTSMSCPNVAGLVGLLKSIHPEWSQAAIKSAIMTTATTKDNTGGNILDSSLENKTTPFLYGAGHIRPNLAVDPGLVYDLNITDYLNYLCGRGYNSSQLKLFYARPYTCPKSFNLANFNYPTITIPEFKVGQTLNLTRTVTNVGSPSKYRVFIEAPPEFLVSVEPMSLRFKQNGEKREFKVTLTLRPQNTKIKTDHGYVFGRLVWTDGKHRVRTPIAIKYPLSDV